MYVWEHNFEMTTSYGGYGTIYQRLTMGKSQNYKFLMFHLCASISNSGLGSNPFKEIKIKL